VNYSTSHSSSTHGKDTEEHEASNKQSVATFKE
jgi:hypothetical protein